MVNLSSRVFYMKKLITLLCLSWSCNVFAYLDPGTGSMIIQAAIAAIAAAAYTLSMYWAQLKAWFSRKNGQDDEVVLDEREDEKGKR